MNDGGYADEKQDIYDVATDYVADQNVCVAIKKR